MNHFLILFICFSFSLSGQTVTGNVTDIDNNPLLDVMIYWKNDNMDHVLTDTLGNFKILYSGKDSVLVFRHAGYFSDQIYVKKASQWTIQLMDNGSLSEVIIKSKSSATRFTNDVAKVEAINVREIQRAACCSLAGCFSTNSNVEANTTNIITDAKELRILGISGVYNQTLVDGMPLIQGLSFPYGPGSYPGTLIEKIFVTKGANWSSPLLIGQYSKLINS